MMKRIFLIYMASMLWISLLYASDSPNLEREFERIEGQYSLCPQKYTEDLTEHNKVVVDAVSQALSSGKQLGIVVGENHEAEGAKCLEMLLLQVAHSAGIQYCLVETTCENLRRIMSRGHNLGSQSGYLKDLIQEAQRLGMQATPVDKVTERKKDLPALEDFKQTLLTGEEREKYFIEQILGLNRSFIFYTGANHLSSLYYDRGLNKNFFLIFIDCSFPCSEKSKKEHAAVIRAIKDESVSRIDAQRQRFLTEAGRIYRLPVMYNQTDSQFYTMLLQDGEDLMGVNPNEIRAGS